MATGVFLQGQRILRIHGYRSIPAWSRYIEDSCLQVYSCRVKVYIEVPRLLVYSSRVKVYIEVPRFLVYSCRVKVHRGSKVTGLFLQGQGTYRFQGHWSIPAGSRYT